MVHATSRRVAPCARSNRGTSARTLSAPLPRQSLDEGLAAGVVDEAVELPVSLLDVVLFAESPFELLDEDEDDDLLPPLRESVL